ncbi:MAG: holo-ACP synthase [Rubinisphaera brasiliensis]|uniref:Holo-[acyl-carrier-protein] synthase n=1 Tax=Rubinisphaera brasiliensis (strain ATCC 49424 / DSM 5305 / JCM 21570 / IAM 15109 / NBRC 103401 / IFAM 1448) TaxID=756272 RepID=F0SM80_RUBBR|nr:holo-ACP synthase [Rubinisphaera brasiliensis]ADY61035.1 Holo-(acyl-carrier-protein) synthase [Rubinisphaera brasiliensis DSM 5305]
MQIVGLGTDIVEIPRIASMIERHGDSFLLRTYSADEIEYCQTKKNAAQHFAGRWAAKEAVMKSFGTGFIKGIHWTEIEVVTQPSGRPIIRLSADTARFASDLGVDQIQLSISHGKEYAVATAIACSSGVDSHLNQT